ncbi:MAG TPA: hypothetical protein V6C58_00515, partial [Allocoleopsis sp.]
MLSEPEILLKTLQDLRSSVKDEGEKIFANWRPLIKQKSFLISAKNLAYYLALRHHDLRDLQTALMPWGLSSLGRSESRVLPNLDAVIYTLEKICQTAETILPQRPQLRAFFRGDRLLNRQIQAVFGPSSRQRKVRIMVTMPTEGA